MLGRLRKNKKRFIGTVIIAVLVVGAAAGVKLYHNQPQTDQQKLQQEEKKTPPDPKKDSEAAQRAQSSPTPATPAGTKPPTPIITTLEEDRSMVILDATVGQATSGSCTIVFTKGGSTISRSVPVVPITSYYSCQELQLPGSAFPGGGTWQVSVVLNNNGQRSDAVTSAVTVQ